ncbi:MAG: DUF814 domain-containing protein [Candidatus Altiarchaeota archaeon]|nr:DUF814 domain-containing protein [Candidatus Altiarchaeota archaeon]
MQIELDTGKTASQNAGDLFTKAKKLEDKVKKAEAAMKGLLDRIEQLKKKKDEAPKDQVLKERKPKGKWYESFRWFFSSSGKLIVGGRDATTNDILMKKHIEKDEWVFHADIVGAPFVAIKAKPETVTKEDLKEAAEAAGIFSRGWKLGYGSLSIYYAPRERFTKQAPSGEYVKKGAFMVYGKKEWQTIEMRAAVGIKDGKVTGGPISAITSWADTAVSIEPGHLKPGEITKKIVRTLKAPADDIQKALPAGKSQVIKQKK